MINPSYAYGFPGFPGFHNTFLLSENIVDTWNYIIRIIVRIIVPWLMKNTFEEKEASAFRSNRSQMFIKIDVLKNFAILTGKHRFLVEIFLLKRDSHLGVSL